MENRYHQKPGFDFNENVIHVVKTNTIRVVLTLDLIFTWEFYRVDINNAFLNMFLQE